MSKRKKKSDEQTLNIELDKTLELIVLRWEFLRRNPEYTKDYNKLLKYAGDWETLNEKARALDKKVVGFCHKWSISHPETPNYDPYEMLRRMKIMGKVDPLKPQPIKIKEKIYQGSPATDIGLYCGSIHEKNSHERFINYINFVAVFGHILPLANPTIQEPNPLVGDKNAWDIDVDDDRNINVFVSEKVATTGKLPLTIDLRYPKQQIMESFNEFINRWKPLYEKAYQNELFKQFCHERKIYSFPVSEEIADDFHKHYLKQLNERLPKQDKRVQDVELYKQYLRVWDLRENEKISWSKIQATLDLNSIQTARDHYKAACKLINEGLPL